MAISAANNFLYFSSGSKLFKRNDGSDPSYEVAHNFNDLSSYINPAVGGIRGLSTVSNPSGSDESLILMWCPNGQSKGTIFRLDPNGPEEFHRVYETKISLLVEDYLPGETVSYILGAYNEFYLFTDPVTDMDLTVIGIESLLQEKGPDLLSEGVFLRVNVEEPQRTGLAQEVRELFPNAVAVQTLSTMIEEPQIARDLHGLDPHDLFSDYLKSKKVQDERLLSLFDQLYVEASNETSAT